MSTRVIINPSAGGGRGAERALQLRPLLESAWGRVEWTISRSPEHVTQLAAEAAEAGYDKVVIAGGDGTVHFAANGVAGTQTALGILPVGTGNDIAASVGLPRDMGLAAGILVGEHVHRVDVGEVQGRIFCCVRGVGMDTMALEAIERSRMRKGRLLYSWAAVRTLFKYRPRPMRISCGDTCFEGDVTFAAVTNTRTYAGGIPICPEANVSDGRLDLCVVAGVAPSRALMTFGRVMSATHGELPGVILRQGVEVVIEAEAPIPITLDGELTALRTDAVVRVLPGALRLLGAPGALKRVGPSRARQVEIEPARW